MLTSRFPSKKAPTQNSQCTVDEFALIMPAAVCVTEEDIVVNGKGKKEKMTELFRGFDFCSEPAGFFPVAFASVSTNVVQVSPENIPPEVVLQTITILHFDVLNIFCYALLLTHNYYYFPKNYKHVHFKYF